MYLNKSFEPIISVEPIDNDNLFELISAGSWKEVLVNLTKDMDPWNIDLFKINDRLTEHIQKMRHMDLTVPSKILLAAAIIYRLKSETLNYADDKDVIGEEDFEDSFGEDFDMETPLITMSEDRKIILPNISLPIKRQSTRKVTLDELIDALGGAMKVKNRREAKYFFQVELNGRDISESIEELYGKINTFMKKTQGIVSFHQLLDREKGREDTLIKFSSLLHLSNQERVYCTQDELFGDIKIQKLN